MAGDRGYASIGDVQSPTASTSTEHADQTDTAPTTNPTNTPHTFTLSTKQQHHRIRFQGRLMLVKSVSTHFSPAAAKDDDGVGGVDAAGAFSVPDTDRQRRGFGIGGAGNIRHPTEVVHFYSSSNRTVADGIDTPRKRRWQWMDTLLGRATREGRTRYEQY